MRTKALWFLLIMTVSLTLTLACGAADEPAAESPGPPSPGAAQTTDAMTPAGSSESAGGAAGAETTGTSSPRTDNSSMPLTANPAGGTQDAVPDQRPGQAGAEAQEASANEATATAQEVPMPTEAAEMTKPAAAESPAEPVAPATPVKAQFDDSRTLAEIYQQVGLEQFHLAECTDQPHCLPDQLTLYQMRNDPTDPFQSQAGGMTVNHPFQHTIAELDFAVKNAPEGSHYSYDLHNGTRTNSPVGLSAFLAAPWFEPLPPSDFIGTRDLGDTRLYCPCHFGAGSLKTSLLNAVVKVITDNLTPEFQFVPLMQVTGVVPNNLRDHLSHGYRFGINRHMERYLQKPYPWVAPQSQVHFIHPELPILQVVSQVETRLPYATDPEIQQGIIWGRTGFSNKQRLQNLPNVSISLVFNLALQRRWDTFDDPRRDINQYAAAYLDYPGPHLGLERGELDPALDELYPNYWHTTDYMHYSVLGPVAVIIEAWDNQVLLKAGTYWVDLPTTEWAADPSVSSPETARIGERPLFDSENDGWPLPGHKVIGTEAADIRPR